MNYQKTIMLFVALSLACTQPAKSQSKAPDTKPPTEIKTEPTAKPTPTPQPINDKERAELEFYKKVVTINLLTSLCASLRDEPQAECIARSIICSAKVDPSSKNAIFDLLKCVKSSNEP